MPPQEVTRIGESGRIAAPDGAAKIRVLHLIYSMTHAGLESTLLNWIRYTDRQRFEVHLCCFAGDRGREKSLLKAAAALGVGPVFSIDWKRSKPVIKAARQLARLVDELQIDILHTHVYYSNLLGAILKVMRPRLKTISTVYVWAPYDPVRFLLQLVDWVTLRFGFDFVTAHCERTRRQTLRMGFPARKVPLTITGFPDEVPPPGPDGRAELRRRASIPDGQIVLLNVARLYREKAHDQLVRSFKIVHERYPNTKLWISGTGPSEQEIRSLIDELGLADVVEIIGFQFDLWPFLHSADIMVHPSHAEGVPLALQYGMAAELPIVTSDIGGVREILEDGHSARLIPENSVEEFAAAVIELIENPDMRRRLGEAGRKFVVERYSIQQACRSLEDVYTRALGIPVNRGEDKHGVVG
jgi:L-malate glycosyltransferase